MRNLMMLIQYDGTKYNGWQKQNQKGSTVSTIQGKIENVLNRMTNEEIQLIGCGRTDTGVHAENYVANFHTESSLSIEDMKQYLTKYLPEDISIKSMEEVNERFHSRYNVRTKTYVYKINNNKYIDVFNRRFTSYVQEELNIEEMRKAAKYLIGNHDFKSFTSLKTKSNKSTYKTINYINIKEKNKFIDIEVNGEGFLLNMVRIIAGTLIDVGQCKIKAEDIKEILEAKDRKKAGHKAEARGLTLKEVNY